MGMIERVNETLKTLLDVDDELYRRLICDKEGAIPSTITKPTDIDIGVIASILEWLRLLSIDLVKQLRIDTASEEYLKYQLNEFFDSLQLEDETTSEWVQRTIAKVFQPKVSRASIISALRPYSSPGDPVISNLLQNSGFMDFSYMDAYNTATLTDENGDTVNVLPAIMGSYEGSFFSIKITLQNTASEDIFTVQNIVDNIITAGIYYVIEIEYTV